jgi:hypothetical protein
MLDTAIKRIPICKALTQLRCCHQYNGKHYSKHCRPVLRKICTATQALLGRMYRQSWQRILKKLWSLAEMERTDGEPDVGWPGSGERASTSSTIVQRKAPSGRRNVCYDRAGLMSRKENRPEKQCPGSGGGAGHRIADRKRNIASCRRWASSTRKRRAGCRHRMTSENLAARSSAIVATTMSLSITTARSRTMAPGDSVVRCGYSTVLYQFQTIPIPGWKAQRNIPGFSKNLGMSTMIPSCDGSSFCAGASTQTQAAFERNQVMAIIDNAMLWRQFGARHRHTG